MSRRFWSADLHLGHDNINEYCKRPFRDATHAAQRLYTEFNMRIKENDTVVHVGDFINYGNNKGVVGLRLKPEEYLKNLNGQWAFVEGNHDRNNRLKPLCQYMFCKISHFMVFVCHYPTNSERIAPTLREYLKTSVDFAVCGHIHDKWKYFFDKEIKLININVGVDCWNYRPISDDELVQYYLNVKKELRI